MGGDVPEPPPPPPPQAVKTDSKVATHKARARTEPVNNVGRGKMPEARDFTYCDFTTLLHPKEGDRCRHGLRTMPC
jgi:hypothetical protein